MLSSIPFLMVPSAPITMGITSVFIFHILCISISRSLYLLFFSISLIETFLSHGTVMSINLQFEFTAMSHSTVCVSVLVTVSGWCLYHLSEVLIPKSLQIFQCTYCYYYYYLMLLL